MILGLLGVVLVGLRERWLFADLFDLEQTYRIVATFSSMHTGGGHIEAYLVMAIPFLWLWILRDRPWLWRAVGIILLLLASYVTLTTISRGGVAALLFAFAILAVGTLRHFVRGTVEDSAMPQRRSPTRLTRRYRAASIAGLSLLALLAVTLVLGAMSGFFQQRLDQVDRDRDIRMAHWSQALALMDHDAATRLLGMGLGRFPWTYLAHVGVTKGVLNPGTYRYVSEGDNTFLRLHAGETLYMSQRVTVASRQVYRLSLKLRSAFPDARLGAPLCEKQLLNSFRCRWRTFSVEGDQRWHRVEASLDTGRVGEGNWLTGRPTELSLFNPVRDSVVDVDEVSLIDAQGREHIYNGDFSEGGDDWFFKTHNHLPWHIKNLAVAVLFEQGWLGLLTLTTLLAGLLLPLLRATWRGELFATVLLAAVGGFLLVGVVASLFDSPRLTTLFFTLLFIGQAATRVESGSDTSGDAPAVAPVPAPPRAGFRQRNV